MGRSIRAEASSHLTHIFPDVDLARVRLLETAEGGLLTRALRRRRIQAVCLGRHIVVAGGVDELVPVGMGLLAHELTHVRQIQAMGVMRFYWAYFRAYLRGRRSGLAHSEAYHAVPFEGEAYRVGALVKADQESGLVAVASPKNGSGATT